MSESSDVVRRTYEAWNAGDFDAALGLLHPAVEVQGHPQLPDPEPGRGREEVRRWFEQLLDAWEEVTVETEELIEAGDDVIAVVRISGRGRGSGAEVRSGLDTHVWTVRDGKVSALRWFQGKAEAQRRRGLRT